MKETLKNSKNKCEIGFASTTFKNICQCFRDNLREYDLEMITLIEDYETFCSESGLLHYTMMAKIQLKFKMYYMERLILI
jgi:hypothetical protein